MGDVNKDGYIMLSRKFFVNEIWQAARAYNEAEAWLDLIQSARFESTETMSRFGKLQITWGRGQYPASNRYLAKKWGRSEGWVKAFLKKLKKSNMITTDNSQGCTVITLVNFDTYNVSNGSENPHNDPLNILNVSDLEQITTHIMTRMAKSLTHIEPKSNKDNNILSSTTSCAYTHACEGNFFDELRNSQIWLESMCMRFHLTTETLVGYINEFELECKCKDHVPENLSDLKRHCHDWIRIQVEKEQNKKNNDRKKNEIPATDRDGMSERMRSKLPPTPECGLIED